MTNDQTALVRQAVELLRLALEETCPHEPAPAVTPVEGFVRDNFMRDAACDYSCAELWGVYSEAMSAGEMLPMKRAEFLKQLAVAMKLVFGLCRSHNVRRQGSRVRGFKGIGPRPLDRPITAAELELPVEVEIVYEPDLDDAPLVGPLPVTVVCSSAPRV